MTPADLAAIDAADDILRAQGLPLYSDLRAVVEATAGLPTHTIPGRAGCRCSICTAAYAARALLGGKP